MVAKPSGTSRNHGSIDVKRANLAMLQRAAHYGSFEKEYDGQ
jgi:hypothetical protein